MKIDLFNHFFPPRYAHDVIEAGFAGKDMGKRVRNVPTIADLDARFRVMDEFGEYCQFLTLPAPPLESMAGPDKTPEFARIANDGLAELVAKYPDRFIGFASSLPMNNVDECLKEIDRSVTQLGARGFQIYTNVAGKPLDLPEFAPLFEDAARRDLIQPMGSVTHGVVSQIRYSLSERGRNAAQDALTRNPYVGPAPVPLESFQAQIERQRITNEVIDRAVQHLAMASANFSRATCLLVGRYSVGQRP